MSRQFDDNSQARGRASGSRAPAARYERPRVRASPRSAPANAATTAQKVIAAREEVMAAEEVGLDIHLGRGDAGAEVLTCDLCYDYVRINAEYHT